MIHEIFPVGPLQCNCSVIGDEASREAIVIDPGDDIDRVLLTLAKHQLTLKKILITHGHIDHVGGAMKLKHATGAPIWMDSADSMQLQLMDQMAAWIGVPSPGTIAIDASLEHDSPIHVGGLSGKAIHTPGHTEGSTCIYFPSEKKLIAGDTLFAGSIGRTDLPGGNFEKIIDSLKQRVLTLPEDTVVVPGHGPATSIGEERDSNPFVR
ncbi:MAG TPA: MBL fold metallo-hydrolase [Terriglobales bacterium]|nr:MBL fold metallo-hydrolase [Terriglobales bacterium]